MKRYSSFRQVVMTALAVAMALLLVACSDDSDGGGTTNPPDPDEGQSFSSKVTAAAGGTLTTGSGKATLDVPAGALAADTELTVKVMASESGTAGSVYEYGPTGTAFSTPATLSIKYAGSPGSGKKAVLGTYSDGKWVEIAGSSASGGVVTGQISHFSKFSIIIIDDQAVVVSGCADVAKNFSPCGGDIKGTWAFQDVCFSNFSMGGNPWGEDCPDATMEFDVTWDATITIDASTMTMAWKGQKVSYAFIAPQSCLPANAQCSDITNQDIAMTCAADGSKCKCTGEEVSNDIDNSTQSYTIEGNTLVVTSGGKREVSPYCRQGNKLIVETEMDAGDDGTQTVYWVLVKK